MIDFSNNAVTISQEQIITTSSKLVVLYFYTKTDTKYKSIDLKTYDLSKKHINVVFIKVDVDNMKSLLKDFNISVFPSYIFLKKNRVLGKVNDWNYNELRSMLRRYE